MTRRLSLLRHAKSDWAFPSLSDHARPLNARGLRDAPQMGAALKERKLRPGLIYCSTATRTRQTYDLVTEALYTDETQRPPVDFKDGLYEAPYQSIAAICQNAPDTAEHLLVIGHNPGLEDILAALLPETAAADLPAKFPTCALADLVLDIDSWQGLRPGVGRLTGFLMPKSLE